MTTSQAKFSRHGHNMLPLLSSILIASLLCVVPDAFGETVTVTFDDVTAPAEGIGGQGLSDYLGQFCTSVTDVAPSNTQVLIFNNAFLYSGQAAIPTSPPNLLLQTGGGPVSYTMRFRTPLDSLSFARVGLFAGPSGITHPRWTATAFDANGRALGSVGEGLIASFSNVPARTFTLTKGGSPGISAVTFASDNFHFAAFASVVIDDLVLTGPQVNCNRCAKIQGAFDPDRYFPDERFGDYTSMGATRADAAIRIKSFLQEKARGRPAETFPLASVLSDQDLTTAANSIAIAAFDNAINPRLLLAEMEKEQRLITGCRVGPTCKPIDGRFLRALGYPAIQPSVGRLGDLANQLDAATNPLGKVINGTRHFSLVQIFRTLRADGRIIIGDFPPLYALGQCHPSQDPSEGQIGSPLAGTLTLYVHNPELRGNKALWQRWNELFPDQKLVSDQGRGPSVTFTVWSPVHLTIIDGLGRHVGIDTTTGNVVNEIPGAAYFGPGTEPEFVTIRDPLPGQYHIVLTGLGAGDYELDIDTFSRNGNFAFLNYLGQVERGDTRDYRMVYATDVGLVPDTTPPVIEVRVEPTTLWPPNHKLVDIRATVRVSDDSDASPRVELTSIVSNEPDDELGDGDMANDIQGAILGAPTFEFQLRAERSGGGSGRIYTVVYTATDASDNSATATATVTVPHDMGRGRPPR